MLDLKGVCTCYGKIQALWDVDLHIHEGEIVTLIGANGAGKSTTLMSIFGAQPVQKGEIFFRGQAITRLSPDRIMRLGISQVPEGRLIFPDMTVLENLQLGAYLRRDQAGIRQDLEKVFEMFPILEKRKGQSGGTLSGGEQQMLAMSRALMARPQLLLLDEPSLGLAPLIIRQIFFIIEQVNRNGATVFLVEQNANQALKIAHRGYVMETGRITLQDDAARLLSNSDIRRAYLGG